MTMRNRINAWLAGLAAATLLAGCTPVVERWPARLPAPESLPAAGIVVAAAPGAENPQVSAAMAAVAAALAARGFATEPQGRYRVDVGFSVGPRQLEVVHKENNGATSPRPARLVLCRRQRYRLSVAMIDRIDGRVVFRNTASTARCGQRHGKYLNELVRAALG